MQIVSKFNDDNIDIIDYLKSCGVTDPQTYLDFNTIEDDSHYHFEKAKEIFESHINKGESIVILGDPDADGACSAGELCDFIKKKYNIDAIVLIHDKNAKAHGLDDDQILMQLTEYSPSLLIVPDAGTSDSKQCKMLCAMGWDIIVLDHHKPDEKKEDNIYAELINNQLIDDVENKYGSGTLVTWHFMHYLDPHLANEYISYVAISLLSDSMNLCSCENGTFIHYGLKEDKIHPNLKPFIDKFNKNYLPLSYSFGGIIPKINATIRVGTFEQKQMLFDSMCGRQKDIAECIKAMTYCTNLQNRERDRIIKDSITIDDPTQNIILGKISEKTSLTGLIAGKLMSKYEKPIILVHDRDNGNSEGSSRSPIDIRKTFSDSGMFNYAQGHEKAFGISYSLEKEEDVKKYLYSIKLPEPHIDVLYNYVNNLPSTYLIDRFEPYNDLWGASSNVLCQPTFGFSHFHLKREDIICIGRAGTTIKFKIGEWEFIQFFVSHEWQDKHFLDDMDISCVGSLSWNEYNGVKTPQVIIDKLIIEPYEVEDLFA